MGTGKVVLSQRLRIHVLQHVPFERTSGVARWAQQRDMELSHTRLFERGASFPPQEAFDMLVILGGPMGAYDTEQYPWLKEEKHFIRSIVDAGNPTLGICLGAQLLAEVLGGRVFPGHTKEIGWYPVRLNERANAYPLFAGIKQKFIALHWHGDTYELPSGCHCLASSDMYRNQAFAFDTHVIGLQFHLEFDERDVRDIASRSDVRLGEAPGTQYLADILANASNFTVAEHMLGQMLDNFVADKFCLD